MSKLDAAIEIGLSEALVAAGVPVDGDFGFVLLERPFGMVAITQQDGCLVVHVIVESKDKRVTLTSFELTDPNCFDKVVSFVKNGPVS